MTSNDPRVRGGDEAGRRVPSTRSFALVVALTLVASTLAGTAAVAVASPDAAPGPATTTPGCRADDGNLSDGGSLSDDSRATSAPAAGTYASDRDRALVVADAASGDRLLAAPVSNATFVGLEYTHSVEKTRVLDGYEVRGDRLVMVRMEFESYGAGLPSGADVNRTADGAFVFDPAGAYEELYVKPGRIAGHVLHVGNRTYDLVALSNASTVRLSVAPRCGPDAADAPPEP